jgi:hypothetical protein
MKLWPTKRQWQGWSLPSKLTAIAALLTVMSLCAYTIEKVFQITQYLSHSEQALQREVYMDFSSACGQWMQRYMSLYPGHFENIEGEYEDVWELLYEKGVREYSPELWLHYQPLFGVGINSLNAKLDGLLRANSDVISKDFRALVLQTQRSLKVEQFVYERLPQISHLVEDKNGQFSYRFQAVIELLEKLDREARRLNPEGGNFR